MVESMDEKSVRALLAVIAPSSELAATTIRNTFYDQQRDKQSERLEKIDYSIGSADVWYILNKKLWKDVDRKELVSVDEAVAKVESCVQTIVTKMSVEMSFYSKQSALDTLRKMIKSIMLTSTTLGIDVRSQMGKDAMIARKMVNIVDTMTSEERRQLATPMPGKNSSFCNNVDELAKMARKYDMPLMIDLLELVLTQLKCADESEDEMEGGWGGVDGN
ncbi:hypothetical protein LTR17_006291 [Elasticomyces elasticus]|nr:hypothetical protein LTR17_006291 [Elasticomyces elasticus]